MKHIRFLYILLASVPLLIAGGCVDEVLLENGTGEGDPNAVKFGTTVCLATDANTRAEDAQVYEPLVLCGDDGADKLYLHTFETPKMGFVPGEDFEPATRGMQVESVEDLERFHKDFMVHARLSDSREEYISWTAAHARQSGSNVWLTDRTEYWPADNRLSFYAVSPSSEFKSISKVDTRDKSFFFNYTAKKGSAGRDAEAQTDLLIATSSCNKSESVQGRAPLPFAHALSAIKFAVRDVMGGEIVNISISGVYGSGDCVYTAAADGSDGLFNWSNHNAKQTYSQNFNHPVNDRIVDPSDDSKDILLNSSMPEKTFMLIPQQIPDDAEIIITLKRTGLTPETKTVRARIKDNLVTEWKAGHEYIYTISTSKDNWVYVLTATGNHDKTTGAHNVDGDMIYVYSPSKKEHDKYHDNAYFKVRSFRYRANNQYIKETLPWGASHGDARQYRVIGPGQYEYVTLRDLKASEWIKDPKGLRGEGSYATGGARHDITFAAHHMLTNWPGDKWMQEEKPYDGNSKDTPWDLSTFGGQRSRSSANCYVIDREGWYCFPLYYGNAMTDGRENTSSFKFGDYYFEDYKANKIKGYELPPEQRVSADIVWADVYNCVTDVQLITKNSVPMILFHANKYSMQQGNVVIAAMDKDETVTWSWHIWVTEHWLEPGTGLPYAYNGSDPETNYESSSTGRRQRGDVLVEVNDGEVNVSRYMAAYNLGWCDAKNVDYLRRPSEMVYVQYQNDCVTPTGLTAALPIVQDGERIEYKYTNTTYYQFGRKDPIVGFVDRESHVKRNFGDKQYDMKPQPVTVQDAMKNPHVLYCKGSNADKDWCSSHINNYWNNSSTTNDKKSNVTVKTVFDPCPAGYCVPPAVIFRFVGKDNKGSYDNSDSNNIGELKNLNGVQVNEFCFKLKRNAKLSTFEDKDAVWISSTGNRWYTDDRVSEGLPYGGENFNWQLAYLWSSTIIDWGAARGLALGLDKKYIPEKKENKGSSATRAGTNDDKYVITPYFYGRKVMARPVRPVREQ